MNQDYESSNKRIKIVTNMNEANQVEFQSAIIRTPLTAIQSPLIRTPHDPQALDEFKGIFAPAAIYSPSKLYIDYQRSPVQRVINPLPTNFNPMHLASSRQVGNSRQVGLLPM
jgi:hypothetical protein